MYISYEELKAMEEQYYEQLRNAQAHLDVIRDLLKIAEAKEPVKSECDETEVELDEPETVETETIA
jgi:hypothetical protein